LMRAPLFLSGVAAGAAFVGVVLRDTGWAWWAGSIAVFFLALAGYLWRNARVAVAAPPRE
jgi:hypothetical protein